ncbi:hypothetical protein BURCENBC7_AP5039 [Burkholderia cenocepacia BC7]|nr:hypothetical protein BURCENK562V_C4310 [Burkholderia cenocepacia K56-2Valvano]ERI26398.1 hypothetical protein BURCENBC7_AP5039 [Burkholderia cenocepacia BC7]
MFHGLPRIEMSSCGAGGTAGPWRRRALPAMRGRVRLA